MSGGMKSLSLAIARGFFRDRTALFFTILFPLMFLVLFGGLFSDQDAAKVELIEVGDVQILDDLPAGAREAFEETFEVSREDDLDVALDEQGRNPTQQRIDDEGPEDRPVDVDDTG